MKKLLLGILLLLVLTGLYFLFYPVDFDPVAYTPPEHPGFEGDFSPNQNLDQVHFILNETGMAPEDIALGPDSALYTGFDDGRIVKFSMEGILIATLGNTIGRPLGMKFSPEGKLIIADEYKGLISMDELGEVEVLTNEVAGTPIHLQTTWTLAQKESFISPMPLKEIMQTQLKQNFGNCSLQVDY